MEDKLDEDDVEPELFDIPLSMYADEIKPRVFEGIYQQDLVHDVFVLNVRERIDGFLSTLTEKEAKIMQERIINLRPTKVVDLRAELKISAESIRKTEVDLLERAKEFFGDFRNFA